MPGLDDARSRAGAARATRARGGVGAAADVARLRAGLKPVDEKRGALCGMAMTERQGGSDVRANVDRRAVARRRRVRARRAQVVLLGADVRRVPRACAGGRRALVLPRPARAAGRDAQRLPHPAAEGQARRPFERVERDRARVGVGAARRRGGTRRADDHRDGQPHASRLRARHGGGDAHGRRARDAPRGPPFGVRQAARRPAADEQRPRRPVRRVRGGDADRAAARARVRPRREPPSRASRPRWRSTGSASAAPATRRRRSSASAATATSRSRCCRGCTASSRSSRSGKGRATSSASTSCAPCERNPETLEAFFAECREAAGAEPRLDAWLGSVERELRDPDDVESRARRLVERLGLALQASLLVRYGDRGGRRCVLRIATERRRRSRLRHAPARRRLRSDRRAAPSARLSLMTRQEDKAAAFRALHEGDAFVIPNPWDAGSARVLAALGFEALATTSSGFAFTLGRLDGGATLDGGGRARGGARRSDRPAALGRPRERLRAGSGERRARDHRDRRRRRSRRVDRGLRPRRATASTSWARPSSASRPRSRLRAASAFRSC